MDNLSELENSSAQKPEDVDGSKINQLTDTEKIRSSTFKSKIPVIKSIKRKGNNTKREIITKVLNVEKVKPKMDAVMEPVPLVEKPTLAMSPDLAAQEIRKRAGLSAQDIFRLRVPKPTKTAECICNECTFYPIFEPRYRKPLVVLDLDALKLIYPAIVPSNRPTILNLLEYVYKHFDIAVWSSFQMPYLIPRLESFELFKPKNKFYINFVLDKTSMYSTFCSNDVEIKDMEVIWNIYPQYNEHNSILVDNYLKKIIYDIYNVAPDKNKINELVDETALRVIMEFLADIHHSRKSFWALNSLMYKRYN